MDAPIAIREARRIGERLGEDAVERARSAGCGLVQPTIG